MKVSELRKEEKRRKYQEVVLKTMDDGGKMADI